MDVVTLFSLILFGVLILIITTNVLRGLRRGLKKSIVSLCFLVGIFIILLIFSGLITKAITSINIGFLNLTIEGVQINYVTEIGAALASSFNLENGAVLGELIVALPLMVINVVIFALLFWVLRLLLWPIYAIVCSLVTKKERAQKKEWKNAGKPQKPIKNGEVMPQKPNYKRGYGALIGIACGIIVCFVTLIPLMGVNSYIQEIGNIQINSTLASEITNNETEPLTSSEKDNKLYAEEDTVGLFELFLDQEYIDYLNIYENSGVGKVLGAVGINKLGALTFDGLTRASVDGENISLRKEINNLIETFGYAETLLVDYDLINADEEMLKNYSQDDWNGIISTSRKVLGKAFDSKIVSVLLNNYFGDIVKLATTDLVEETIENEVDSLILKEVIVVAIDHVVSIGDNHEASKFLYTELDKILGLAQSLNNYNLLVVFINGNYENVLPDSVKQDNTLEGDILKDFDVFVNYMNTLESNIYNEGKYISSLSKELSSFITSSALFGDLLPELEEALIRGAYKDLCGEEKYNSVFTPNYLLEEGYPPAEININTSIARYKSMNTDLFASVFETMLNGVYNYDAIIEIIDAFNGENGMEDAIKLLNSNANVKALISSIGKIVDIVTSSQAMPQSVKNDFVDKAIGEAEKAIKEMYEYDTLPEGDANIKLCDAIVNILNNAGDNIKESKCESLIETIVDSFIKAFDAVQELSNITEINPEDIKISDITNVLQDITSGDGALITNEDIAGIIEPVLNDLATSEDITNPLLSGTIGEGEDQKTITQIITNNIANNNVNWNDEGAVIEEIAQKAIEITQNEEGDVDALVDEIDGLLDDLYEKDEQGNYKVDEQGNKVSSSNIITPELIEYFKGYLNKNFKSE